MPVESSAFAPVRVSGAAARALRERLVKPAANPRARAAIARVRAMQRRPTTR